MAYMLLLERGTQLLIGHLACCEQTSCARAQAERREEKKRISRESTKTEKRTAMGELLQEDVGLQTLLARDHVVGVQLHVVAHCRVVCCVVTCVTQKRAMRDLKEKER